MDVGLEWWRIVTLVLIIGLLSLFAAWLNRDKIAQKFSPGKKTAKMIVRESYWLNSKTQILLLEVDRELFLLAQSPNHFAWQPLKPKSKSIKHEKNLS